VFARQTGMACSACHFNHFPLLNPFGRAFKSSGYTLMGGTEQIEGEDLALPNRLNMAMLATAGHTSVSTAGNGTTRAAVGENGWFMPGAGGEMNLFIGGKVTEIAGFLTEFGLGGQAIGGGSGKLLILPEVADGVRAGVALYQIGQGPAGSFELLNTGATGIHRLMGNTGFANAAATGGMDHISVYSARQFIAPEVAGTGVTGIVSSADNYFVTYGRFAFEDGAGGGAAGAGISSASNLPGQYVRGVVFFDLAGFDSAAGIQNWSGVQTVNTDVGAVNLGEYKATVIDFQMQGEVGGQGLGIYASYGTAPKSSAAQTNPWNASTTDNATSLNIAADYTVMPKITLQGAIRSAKVTRGAVAGTQASNAIMVGVGYELAMNQHLTFNYTANSGSAWDAAGVNAAVTGKSHSTLLLESFF
jgi:hypothetical protein